MFDNDGKTAAENASEGLSLTKNDLNSGKGGAFMSSRSLNFNRRIWPDDFLRDSKLMEIDGQQELMIRSDKLSIFVAWLVQENPGPEIEEKAREFLE